MADYGITQNKGNDVLIDDSSIKHNNSIAKNIITRLNNNCYIMLAKSNASGYEPIVVKDEEGWLHFPMPDIIFDNSNGLLKPDNVGKITIGKGIKAVKVSCRLSWRVNYDPNIPGYVFYRVTKNNESIVKCIEGFANWGSSSLDVILNVKEGDIIASSIMKYTDGKKTPQDVSFYNWVAFTEARACYMTVEVIAFDDENL